MTQRGYYTPDRRNCEGLIMEFLMYLVRAWARHLMNLRHLLIAENKRRWISENGNSVMIGVLTLAICAILYIAAGRPWGAMDGAPYFKPTKWTSRP